MTSRLQQTLGVITTLRRARMIAPMRPDRYLKMAAAMRREGMGMTVGFASAAQRCPDRPALIDELGTLTWRQLDERVNTLAAALQQLTTGRPKVIGVMCRNHRGFVESVVASSRIGSDVVLLNTSFAGPAMADVVNREGVEAVIYDEEFTATVDRALADRPDTTRILAWTDTDGELTLEKLIADHAGQQPERTGGKGRMILLTSGTTGTPKGAKQPGGGAGLGTLKAILDHTPWRAEETIVIVAPMFHAWGFSQLIFAASTACTVVTRANSTRRPPWISSTAIRRRVIYNNYNATEAGMIATATPQDLRAAPDTAGPPAGGIEIRILDPEFNEVPTSEIGSIYVRNDTQFDGYTEGSTKDFHAGFMSSGDVGYLDEAGRLFVVGRDDEMIVSGGENVYPIEVEKTLVAHPEVAEAAVIGVDDEQYGQRLAAFVVFEPEGSATPDVLKQHVRDNLANYKVPRELSILDELPRGSTGKVLRNELKSMVTG